MSCNIVFASTAKEFMPNAIRWFTRSKWSHSLLTTPDYLKRSMCIEVAGNGISMLDFDLGYRNNPQQAYEVYEINKPINDKSRVVRELLDYLEKPYAYLSYAWFIWRFFLRLFKKDIKSQDNWYSNSFVCSGLLREYLGLCGLGYLTSEYGKGSFSTQDLYEVVISNPEMFKLVEKKAHATR